MPIRLIVLIGIPIPLKIPIVLPILLKIRIILVGRFIRGSIVMVMVAKGLVGTVRILVILIIG